IRLRYRSDWGPTVFLTSQKPDGGFGGNFEYRIPQRRLKPDASGWWEVEVPLSEFECVKACEKRGFSLDANSISKILVSIEEGKRLQIESVSVTPGPEFPIK
ncbi:MAG: hypothetical protein KDM64_03675, partial [Verrucomicrobiae bacterium]|nr:hypothetical protein [Verrucomicrobiae bacterium]